MLRMNESPIRPLREDEVRFKISIVPEHIPVRGNALASGDPAIDRAAEEAILARLDQGDIWAWCTVFLTARWRGFDDFDVLGCCSYEDEEDFKRCDYYADMKDRALEELNRKLQLVGELVEAEP